MVILISSKENKKGKKIIAPIGTNLHSLANTGGLAH
jgi:hypothetical protein